MICYSYLDMIHDRMIYQLWHGVYAVLGRRVSVGRHVACSQGLCEDSDE
jgi:hypothetical protein